MRTYTLYRNCWSDYNNIYGRGSWENFLTWLGYPPQEHGKQDHVILSYHLESLAKQRGHEHEQIHLYKTNHPKLRPH